MAVCLCVCVCVCACVHLKIHLYNHLKRNSDRGADPYVLTIGALDTCNLIISRKAEGSISKGYLFTILLYKMCLKSFPMRLSGVKVELMTVFKTDALTNRAITIHIILNPVLFTTLPLTGRIVNKISTWVFIPFESLLPTRRNN